VKPNVVFIISDNQSPWTLGCYGNTEILTPGIDRLAQGGFRFTNAMCSNPVCSPNRATCLTGLMPSQHGVHSWLGMERPDAQMGPEAYCTIQEFDNLPARLAAEGYRCGLSGKWHLGDSLNPQLGFDYWFTKPKGHTATFYNDEAIWQGQVYREPGYYLEAITDHAVDFLQQADTDPFFLTVGYNGPYGLDRDMREGHRNRHTSYYADKELTCFPREDAHPWLAQNLDCIGNPVAMRSYAAAVSGVDDGVSRLLDTLAELGLEENTLVIYTADHGFCAGHNGYWGMSDHGRPLAMYEQNLRVPLILRHPAKIPAGKSCPSATCNYDLFPSLLDYLGLPAQGHDGLARPGRSYVPTLLGETMGEHADATFHEYENARTIRTPEWKLTRRTPGGPNDLYHIAMDPQERQNLFGQVETESIQRGLHMRLDTFFETFSQPEHDLWNRGRSKAGRAISE